jgi:hypothetical protein
MVKLETLADKTTHEVMVPFTKKAFMPGHLVRHLNEIFFVLEGGVGNKSSVNFPSNFFKI